MIKLSKMQVLITGCYKSGTEYTTQLLDNHPEFAAKIDIIGFMRYCFGKYDQIENEYNYSKLVYDAAHRIKFRTRFKVNVERILDYCKDVENVTYPLLYDLIASDILFTGQEHSWADKTQLVWTKIPSFLEMFPNGKVIHVIRDPRNVMASFKKSTYAPDPLYMGAVFNCHDSMRAGLKYKKDFPNNKYYLVQFEDLLRDTRKVLVDIFEFLELSHDHNLLTTLSWVDPKGKRWRHNSSFMDRDDNIVKFDKQGAIDRWRLHLTDKDIALCEAVNGKIMKAYGYECSNVMIEWNEMIEKVISEDTLTRYLRNWICEGKGVEEFPTDPLKTENWSENN